MWQKYRTTLSQDLARIDPAFEFPTVRDPGDGAGARGPTPAEEKAYQDLVKSRNVPLSTVSAAVTRLLVNYRCRASALEGSKPSISRLQNAVGSHAHVNTRNNDTAICSLVVDDAREQLVEDGTRYLLEGIKQRLLTVVDAVFEYLWSTKLRKFATRHNASFMDRVTQQVKDAIESIMNSMYHQLVAFQTQALDGVTVEFPAMCVVAACLGVFRSDLWPCCHRTHPCQVVAATRPDCRCRQDSGGQGPDGARRQRVRRVVRCPRCGSGPDERHVPVGRRV